MKARATLWLGAALLVAMLFGVHVITDPDLFQQVAVGRQLIEEPASLGSASYHEGVEARPYVADKWLTSLLAALFARGGETGLAIYQLLLVLAASGAWWWMLRRWGASHAVSAGALALILAAAAFRLEPRPETSSHALLALVVGLMATPRAPRTLAILAAGLLALWVNLHVYFLNGLLALFAGLVAAVFGMAPPALEREGRGSLRVAAIALGGGLAGALFHPQFLRATTWPFRQIALLGEHEIYTGAIQELFPSWELFEGAGAATLVLLALPFAWALLDAALPRVRGPAWRLGASLALALPWIFAPPPGLAQIPYRLTLACFAVALVHAPAALRARELFPLLLFAGFTFMAIPIGRNLALVPPMAVLLVVRVWSHDVSGLGLAWKRALPPLAAAALLCAAGLRLGDWLAPGLYTGPGWTGWGIDEAALPHGAADFVAREDPSGAMFNDFHGGGALLARLHPERRVFIAGNTSFYPPARFEEYRAILAGGTAALDALQDTRGVGVVVVSHASLEAPPLLRALVDSRRWALVFADAGGSVWLARNAANEALIARHGGRPGALLDRLAAEMREEDTEPLLPFGRRRVYPALNVVSLLVDVGRFTPARELGERLWSRGPSEPIALLLARAAEGQADLPSEIPRLEHAFAEWPRSKALRSMLSRAFFVRGVNLLDAGRSEDGIRDLTRARTLAPLEPGPRLALARALAIAGLDDDARRELRWLMENADDDVKRFVESDPLLAPLL